MNTHFKRGALGAALAGLGLAAWAQAGPSLSEVTVTGGSGGGAALAPPAERLEGNGLLLRGQPSLGETLDKLPGVSSTYFGPAASRPVVRGLDGERVRIVSNGGATLDASSLSFDHAVPVDPLATERIEVLRGPAALQYGGNGLGGVVNLVDSRIPRAPIEGATGRAEAQAASGDRSHRGAVMVEGGNERFALHADAFDRRAGDVAVPASQACAQGGALRTASRICNSASHARGGAVGGTAFADHGYLGASVASYRSDYGSPAEDEVTIGMRSNRYALDGLWRPVAGPFASLRLQAARSEYRHTEFEAGVPGTTFRNEGNDLRLEARHLPLARQGVLGGLDGLMGLQLERSRFAADGTEAFAPYSRSGRQAAFLYEELPTAWGRLSLGARRESVRVESLGNPLVGRFATGARSFEPTSLALGLQRPLSPAWTLTAQAVHGERAPRDYELFANGPHVATGAWELGNASLGLERANQLELGAQWKQGPHAARVAAFTSRFSNYIALQATGASRTAASGDVLPEYAYVGVPARLQGLEASGTRRLSERAGTWDLEWRGDLVRGDNLATGEPLPRIAPLRAGATLAWNLKPWSARIGFDSAMRQDRVPAGDRATPGYTLWHAALTRQARAGNADLLWFARVDNLGNAQAQSATSILTQTAPGRVPLPGRSVRVGLRADF